MRKIAVLALLALVVPAMADTLEAPRFAGNLYVDLQTGTSTGEPRDANTPAVVIYDNMTPPAKGSRTSWDIFATWGDEAYMTDSGIVKTFGNTLVNSSSSAGNLVDPTIQIDFYDSSAVYLGGFYGTVTGSLPKGYYWNITWTDLDTLGLQLYPNTDVIITQKVLSYGAGNLATRVGVVYKGPIAIGASPDQFYWSGTDPLLWPSGPGWYSSTSGTNDQGFSVGIVPEPASLGLLALGALALLRRR